MKLTLADLATPEGVAVVVQATGGTNSFYNQPQQGEGLRTVAEAAIAKTPNLGRVPVRVVPNLPNAFYNYERGEIILGIVNPAVLAHEIEHARNIQQEGLYRKMLRVAEGVTRLNNLAAMPAVLGLRTFLDDESKRDDILKTLAGLSAAVAAPGLVEEASASLQALKKHPDKLEFSKTLAPAFMAHLMHRMSPVLTYHMGRSDV
jgi:plasmid stabilization system protein ParE